jgi:hypothetical protein
MDPKKSRSESILVRKTVSLRGWIDKVWERYRVAKGLTTPGSPELQKYEQALHQACHEMDVEIEILKAPSQPVALDCPPDVDEAGDFHLKVRPIFESAANGCVSCHGPATRSSRFCGNGSWTAPSIPEPSSGAVSGLHALRDVLGDATGAAIVARAHQTERDRRRLALT